MTVLTWSDDRVEQLKKLWEAGLSASQIAAELGNVTRNAVIGKVHRLGLSGRAKSPSSAAPRQRKARPAQHMMRVSRPVSRGNTALAHAFEVEMEPDPIAFDNVVPMSQRLSLLELNEATCHWPVGDPSSPSSSSAAARRSPACPTARITRASRINRRPIAAVRRRSRRGKGGRKLRGKYPLSSLRTHNGTHNHRCQWLCFAGAPAFFYNRDLWLWVPAIAGTTMVRACEQWSATAPPSQTDHPAHSRRRARCGSGPARGRD